MHPLESDSSEAPRRRNRRLHRPVAADRVTPPPKLTDRDQILFALLARLRVLDTEQLFHLAAAATVSRSDPFSTDAV